MRFVLSAVVVICLWVGAVSTQAAAPDAKPASNPPAKKINPNDPVDMANAQMLFEKVFGDYARLDPARIKEILDNGKKYNLGRGEPAVGQRPRLSRRGDGAQAQPGVRPTPRPAPVKTPFGGAPATEGRSIIDRQQQRFYYDTNNDGRPEEVWFLDTSRYAPAAAQPILVRVIDEGGDLVQGGEPDQVNDLWVVDWHADGIVDSVIEFQDLDGDRAAERETMYWVGPTLGYFSGERMRALVYTDYSDTHKLLQLFGYKYAQEECQWRTPFGPDQVFHSFVFEPDRNLWVTYWENPFAFYDLNHDGAPDEAIRFSGGEGMIDSYRHSFDAVGAAPADGTIHHYDCSISAVTPGCQWDTNGAVRRGASNLRFNPKYCEAMQLRGVPTQPTVQWDKVRAIGDNVIWARTMLTWVEDGQNCDPADKNFNERWEGVITRRVLTPEQEKIEAAANEKGNANDLEKPGHKKGQPLKGSFYKRENSIFPRVGSPECGDFNRRFELILDPSQPVAMYYQPVDQRIHIVGADKSWLDVDFDRDGRKDMGYELKDTNRDGVIDTWSVDVDNDGKADDTWKMKRGTAITFMPYRWLDVSSQMKAVIPAVPQMLYAINLQLEKAIAKTNPGAPKDPLAAQLENAMRAPCIPDALARKYVNSDEGLRYWLDVLKDRRIVELRKSLKSRSFWKDFDGARSRGDLAGMLQALVSYNGKASEAPEKLYAEWTGRLRSAIKAQTVSYKFLNERGNACWESEQNAYRVYNGQFDLYYKLKDQLITRLGNWGNYHREQPWGMDIFLLGGTAGLGGVTLFVNDQPYPVRNPSEVEKPGDIHFTASLAEITSDSVTLEYKGEGVGPKKAYTVTWRLTANGGRRESTNEITVTGGRPGDKIEIGLEMTRLPKDEFLLDTRKGVMASRGFEGPEIGWIGLGLIFPADQLVRTAETASSHMAVVKAEAGKPVTYYTQGDWIRGRRFSFGPTVNEWFQDMQKLSDEIYFAQ
ncbi:MAG: DUF4861 family protein [Candidatus Sumerlaeia bacterium]